MKIIFDSEVQRDIMARMLANEGGGCPSSVGLEEPEQPRGCISCEVCWRDAIKVISEVIPNDQG